MKIKNILGLFSAFSLLVMGGASVTACTSSIKDYSLMNLENLKAEFKNNSFTISNSWNNFWGNLNDLSNHKSYYQLLLDQLFDQNNIDKKYEDDVVIQQKNKQGNYVKASALNQMTKNGNVLESNTNLRIHIIWNGDCTDISSFVVNWKLTHDQQPIYPLFNHLQKHNQLNIYDTLIKGYPNNKIAIKNYNQQLKVAFNEQYQGSNNYQYTNFKTNLASKTLNTNDESNKLGLVISNGQSLYNDNNFVINFYNIRNTFNSLNDIYQNDPKNFLLDSFGDYPSFLRDLGQASYYGCPQIINYYYQNTSDFTFKGALPRFGDPIKTITILYKKEIMAKVRAMYA